MRARVRGRWQKKSSEPTTASSARSVGLVEATFNGPSGLESAHATSAKTKIQLTWMVISIPNSDPIRMAIA